MKRDQSKDAVYYHVILGDPDLYNNIDVNFFEGSPIEPIYDVARGLAIKYKSAPTLDDMLSKVQSFELDQKELIAKYDPARIKVIYSRKEEVVYYSKEILTDEIKTLYKWISLQKALETAISEYRLMDDQITPDNIDKAMTNVFSAISEHNVVDFEDEQSNIIDFWNPESHKAENLVHWSTGYDYFNICLDGGYWPGSLHLILGAPKVGKSMWLCNMAARSVIEGNDTMYITLEMPNFMVAQRLGSCLLKLSQIDYKMTRNDPDSLGKVMARVRKTNKVPIGELSIMEYPTDTLTAVKMAELIRKEEEHRSTPDKPFKFKTIFVDYLSIMRSSLKDRSNMYLDGKRKAEEVRAQSKINNWAIISAVQTNKSQFGSSDIDETQVSESSGYNATVDSMFGIIHDEDMAIQNKYKLKCIYDRIANYQNMYKDFEFSSDNLRMDEIGDMYNSSVTKAHIEAVRNESSLLSRKGMASSTRINGKKRGEPVISEAKISYSEEDVEVPSLFEQAEFVETSQRTEYVVPPVTPAPIVVDASKGVKKVKVNIHDDLSVNKNIGKALK